MVEHFGGIAGNKLITRDYSEGSGKKAFVFEGTEYLVGNSVVPTNFMKLKS